MRKPLALLILLPAFLFVSAVSAYFAGSDAKENAFSVGIVTTGISEEYVNPGTVFPGEVIPKTVRIRNTGDCPCYVRVQALFSDSAMENVCTVDYNRTDWAYSDADGWWYYRLALDPGGRTNPLFSVITIDAGADADALSAFDIIIRQESRQSYGTSSWQQAWA